MRISVVRVAALKNTLTSGQAAFPAIPCLIAGISELLVAPALQSGVGDLENVMARIGLSPAAEFPPGTATATVHPPSNWSPPSSRPGNPIAPGVPVSVA